MTSVIHLAVINEIYVKSITFFVGHSQKYDPKGKGILLDGDDLDNKAKSNLEQDSSVQAKDYQEKLDEM